MGFLDELKRRADALRSQQDADQAVSERNMRLADAACKSAFDYFNVLATQFNVIRPESGGRFELDRLARFEYAMLDGFRVDARRKRLNDHEVFDHVVMRWTIRGGEPIELVKEFPAEIDRLEMRLRQAGLRVEPVPLREAESGKVIGQRFAFTPDLAGSVLLTPLHDEGRVRIQLDNLDALETITFDLAAFELTTARLDELAKWLDGEPSEFLAGNANMRRTVV